MKTLTVELNESDDAWISGNIIPDDLQYFLRAAIVRGIEQERGRRMEIRQKLQEHSEFHNTPTDSEQLEMNV